MIHDQIPTILLSTLCYAFWLSFSRTGSVEPKLWPLVWLGFSTFILCNPFPINHRRSRMWFIRRFAELLVSGLKRVEVRTRRASPEATRTHEVALSSPTSGWGSSALLFDPLFFPLTLRFSLDPAETKYAASTSRSLTYISSAVSTPLDLGWTGTRSAAPRGLTGASALCCLCFHFSADSSRVFDVGMILV